MTTVVAASGDANCLGRFFRLAVPGRRRGIQDWVEGELPKIPVGQSLLTNAGAISAAIFGIPPQPISPH